MSARPSTTFLRAAPCARCGPQACGVCGRGDKHSEEEVRPALRDACGAGSSRKARGPQPGWVGETCGKDAREEGLTALSPVRAGASAGRWWRTVNLPKKKQRVGNRRGGGESVLTACGHVSLRQGGGPQRPRGPGQEGPFMQQ